MTFHEQLNADIGRTFLNTKEFATEHEIGDGNTAVTCLMVISGTGNAALLTGAEIRVGHIAAALETKNLPPNHSLGCTIFLDGITYTVENEPVDAH
jgi:hypothetical protein